ncbi:MAG: hypothetical protein GYB41_03840 [Oceanospirillales bacterium]|nr:hypothetical protein [Oceanospirillales bacterium]
MEELESKLNDLATENAQLRTRMMKLESRSFPTANNAPLASKSPPIISNESLLALDPTYSFDILDPATRITRKQEEILLRKARGDLDTDRVYLSSAVTAIANIQKSNSEDQFGYLMRHPTANNQRTDEVSEAALHSAQLAITANLGDGVTAYTEMLYDPQQSFGTGTNTDLNRNQVQVRHAYIMLGNLNTSPWYASVGKMAIPFGLTDTPNPFTASTVWHAYGGLANGIKVGYLNDGINIRLMGVQGGAQFRAANVPVDGSNIPSKLNNYSLDANYTFPTGANSTLLLGTSYLKGSAYCQGYPVTHFSACDDENGAWDAYAQWHQGPWMVQAEYATTEDEWPGTYNPALPDYAASKVTSWGLGTKYSTSLGGYDMDLSADFSRFIAGPSGSPWERQDQWVLGIASYPTPSAKFFAEFIHIEGYAPLNFISGGNHTDPTQTHSNADANSNILMLGGNVAF